MWIFKRFSQWLPSPFKAIRDHLKIEREWQEFKFHIRPHKYKIYLGVMVVTYPLYSSQLIRFNKWASYQVAARVNAFLQTDKATFQITDNL